jgi:hypothetical protein
MARLPASRPPALLLLLLLAPLLLLLLGCHGPRAVQGLPRLLLPQWRRCRAGKKARKSDEKSLTLHCRQLQMH